MRKRNSAIAVVLAGVSSALIMVACTQTGGGGGIGGPAFNLPPTPVITVDVSRGVAPLTVRFSSDRSSDDGVILEREWDFGDGSPTSMEISPSHTYASTGEFTVRLTLTDDDATQSSRTQVIRVTQAPTPVITVDRTAAEAAPAVFSFDATRSSDPDGEITEYRWDFGDGSIEFLPTLTHTYATPGTFRAVLTVTDDTGVTASTAVLIQVGIETPAIEVRVPSDDVQNVVISQNAPLFVQAVFNVEPGVPRFIRAGVDGDRDQCEAQTVVYNAANNTELLAITGDIPERRGHGDKVNSVIYAPDGTIFTASDDGTVHRHNASNGLLLGNYGFGSPVNAIALAPSGATFVAGLENGDVVLRRVSDGATLLQLREHQAAVNAVAFSPNGSQFLSGGLDRRAILWQTSDGQLLRDFTHQLGVNAVAFSPADATIIATGAEDTTVTLWNATSGDRLLAVGGHTAAVNALIYNAAGTRILTGSDDNTARLIDANTGALILALPNHGGDVVSVAFSPNESQILTGATDAIVRIWNASTGALIRSLQPCRSPISAIDFSPAGTEFAVGVAARNDIQLDTDPSNGNDLNLTYPVALQLNDVPSLNGEAVPADQYFLWTEIDTDRTDPVRVYANPIVNVIAPMGSTITNTTPVIPYVSDQATVIVDPTQARQIFDLGPLNQGDRIFMSFSSQPGFGSFYDNPTAYDVTILDGTQTAVARYQGPGFVLFTVDSKLVVGHASPHYYVVVDGGQSLNLRIQRNAGFDTRRQRVLVNFAGGAAVRAGDEPATDIPPLNAADFNQFFATSPGYTSADTTLLKQAIMQTLRNAYADYAVDFFTSDDATAPALPFLTMHVGGRSVDLFGVADYIDVRNETATGTGITFALSIGDGTIENQQLQNPVNDLNELGSAIGFVAAHEIGHLLGLRHTSDAGDIMESGQDSGDPTVPRTFKSALYAASEQLFGLPAIGIQNAPQYLIETVGRP